MKGYKVLEYLYTQLIGKRVHTSYVAHSVCVPRTGSEDSGNSNLPTPAQDTIVTNSLINECPVKACQLVLQCVGNSILS